MKVCIFAHARSGSTFFQRTIAKKYDLKVLNEIFNTINNPDQDPYELMKSDNIIFKIMSHDLNQQKLNQNYICDIQKINWDNFDEIWITQRKNLVDALCSSYIAKVTQEYGRNAERQSFTVDKKFLIEWTNNMNLFFEYKDKIMKLSKKCNLVYHEDIINEHMSCDLFSPSNFNYSVDCKNYTKVESYVHYFEEKFLLAPDDYVKVMFDNWQEKNKQFFKQLQVD